MTFKQLFEKGAAALKAAKTEDAEFDARELLLEAASFSETEYLLNMSSVPDAQTEEKYTAFINRRSVGEPLQYIIGRWDFFGNEFAVGKGVLIPRPETEQLADMCIKRIKKGGVKTVYDLCAGTGCIGISIAKACPGIKVFLLEKYSPALDYCKKNIELNGVLNAEAVCCDIFSGIPESLPPAQLIVSNPPYIPADQLDCLPRELHFEPETALCGGNDGLDFYRAIAAKWVKKSLELIYAAFECGDGQCPGAAELFSTYGKVEKINDIFGLQRFVCCKINDLGD